MYVICCLAVSLFVAYKSSEFFKASRNMCTFSLNAQLKSAYTIFGIDGFILLFS